ncbi:MAG TPA: S8 family serine peptidase [Gaiellaceae bacterium]|nr:S8 family serine peptidase [Gaiellaceae bacterium]
MRIALLLALLAVSGASATALPASTLDSAAPAGQAVPGHYVVVLRSDVRSAADVTGELARQHGLSVSNVYEYALKGFAAAIPEGRVTAVRDDARVASVQQERTFRIADHGTPTGVDRIEADKRTSGGVTASGYHAAVLDTGIDGSHPELNVKGGRNFSTNDANAWSDGNGHGTHVAGTIGAKGIHIKGVAPDVGLWALKVCKNGGICFTSHMVAGIDEMTACKKKATGADSSAQCRLASGGVDFAVANMSIGTSDETKTCSQTSNALHLAICGAVNSGVVFGLAAGNDNREKKAYPTAFAVAAIADFDGKGGGAAAPTCRSDVDDTRADFSNWGVDITAPGTCILSTWPGGGYNTISGTSMATPHAAGAVALYLRVHNQAPATSAAGVAGIESAILDAAIPANSATNPCSYTNDKSSERLLFVNAAAFGGDGSCDVAGGSSTALAVSNVSASPNPFTPNGDGIDDTTTVSFDLNKGANWTATVKDGGGTTVCTTGGSAASAGTYSFVWDGTNGTGCAGGETQPNATYSVTIDGAAESENAQGSTSVTVGELSSEVTVVKPSGTDGYATEGGKLGTLHLLVTVELRDASGSPMASIPTSIQLDYSVSDDGTADTSYVGSGTTGSNGQVTFKLTNAASGWYWTEVTAVTVNGVTSDPPTPANKYNKTS